VIDIEVQFDELRIVITWPSADLAPTRSQPNAKGAPTQPAPWLPRTIATSLCVHESSVLSRLRKRLAERFEQPIDHRFFSESYLPGEIPNEALLRLFKQRQWMVSLTDEETIESMAKRR
jgi:hypothetical protein